MYGREKAKFPCCDIALAHQLSVLPKFIFPVFRQIKMLCKGTLWLTQESSVIFRGKYTQEFRYCCMMKFFSTPWSY